MKVKEMRALSITQPSAHCIVSKTKNSENRSWNTHRRGYIAIHASSSFKAARFDDSDLDPNELDYGAIVGFAKLVEVVKEDGEYNLMFEDVMKLKEPVEVKGMLGFWEVDKKVLNKCLCQLNEKQLNRLTRH